MRSFCIDPLWDWQITWNTTNPDFTRCFEDTILVWIPCLFLWILAPYEFYRTKNSDNKPIPWTILNIFKMMLTLALCIVSIADMIDGIYRDFSGQFEAYRAEYYAAFVKLISFSLVATIMLYHKSKGINTSGVLFFFWLFLCIPLIAKYRTLFNNLDNKEDALYNTTEYSLLTEALYVPIVVSQFILSCFSDAIPLSLLPGTNANKKCPENSVSFLSQLTFNWFTAMTILGMKKPLTKDDMWELDDDKQTRSILRRFNQYMFDTNKEPKSGNREKSNPTSEEIRRGIFLPMVLAFWPSFLFAALCKLVANCLTFVNPIILDYLITFVSGNEPLWQGYVYVLTMAASSATESLLNAQYEKRVGTVAMKMRSCMVATIYKKSLRVSSFGNKEFTTGEIVNLMAVDTQKVIDYVQMVNLLWAAPLQIALCIYLLWAQLGLATLSGLGVMLILLPVNAYCTAKLRSYQFGLMREKDKRTKLMNEILNGIKVIKMFSWEEFFSGKIKQIRGREIASLRTQAYIWGAVTFAFTCTPFLVGLASFATFVLIDPSNVLDPNKAFVSLSLFNILRFPLSFMPVLVSYAAMSLISQRRINKYLLSEELDTTCISHDPNESDAVTVANGSFSWDKDAQPVLSDINLSVKHGKLVAIVGNVGCGKSSLLSSLLGDLHKNDGYVNISGSVAYVPQQAWILNETIRQNILFAKPYDRTKYRKVLQTCALEPDLKVLEGGDLCEIGEKGINLSGGQKQRVSLARAVYSDADIYFLDDPLSAVDSHVSRHLFDKVLGPKGCLKSKTRIIVTHRITILPQVDEILVLKDGRISEQGTYSELISKQGDFAEMIVQYLDQDIEDPEEIAIIEDLKETVRPQLERLQSRASSDTQSERGSKSIMRRTSKVSTTSSKNSPSSSQKTKTKARLIEEETAQTGSIKWSVYKKYFIAMGLWAAIITLGANTLQNVFSMSTSLWLTAWSNDATDPATFNDTSLRNFRLSIYGVLGMGETVFVLVATIVLNIACLNASQSLHNTMFGRIIFAPMSFFDTTPLGRILNRFTKDIDTADVTIRFNLRMCIAQFFRTIVALILVSLETPLFIVAAIPLGLIYYFVQRYYITTSRQLRRIESVTRSPIYTHFSESVNGSNSIRAYNVSGVFIDECYKRLDIHHSANYPSIVASRWLSVRLEFLGYIITTLAALFAVLSRGSVSPGIAGLSISYALTITGTLNMLVRSSTELETNIVSIERCLEYNDAPVEAPRYIDERKPRRSWPEKGCIEFRNYSTAYRTGLQLVLKDVNFEIKPREKVGVVGRTGAGKSSLTLALFRIIEPMHGTIFVDGVDISKLGLHDLRSRITIIPQDPILFTGSIRMNLDPSESIQDDSLLWTALDLANLGNYVRSLDMGLNHIVVEGGENLSVGQRQLLCLARAILRKSKILILDEATAAVDVETDDLIQKTIRSEFEECTVLTIAHRLNTVMDYDKILVLQNGEVAEFETPKVLLENTKSIFYGMAKDANLV